MWTNLQAGANLQTQAGSFYNVTLITIRSADSNRLSSNSKKTNSLVIRPSTLHLPSANMSFKKDTSNVATSDSVLYRLRVPQSKGFDDRRFRPDRVAQHRFYGICDVMFSSSNA